MAPALRPVRLDSSMMAACSAGLTDTLTTFVLPTPGGKNGRPPGPFLVTASLLSWWVGAGVVGVGISSVRLAVSALRKLQALSGVALTANDQIVVDTVRGLVNRGAFVPRQAAALTTEVLAAISATALRTRRGRSGCDERRSTARKGGLACWLSLRSAATRGPG